jgi:hypothetical protein
MKRRASLLVVATSCLSLACSERSPTAPQSALATVALPSSASPQARERRPPTRVLGPREDGKPVPPDVWGSDKAELTVTAAGAAVRLFCAHGTVEQPLTLDVTGHFAARGFLVREGGPVPIDETPFRRPAGYAGWTDGRTMILEVTPDMLSALGPFVLIRGQKGSLSPCPIL